MSVSTTAILRGIYGAEDVAHMLRLAGLDVAGTRTRPVSEYAISDAVCRTQSSNVFLRETSAHGGLDGRARQMHVFVSFPSSDYLHVTREQDITVISLDSNLWAERAIMSVAEQTGGWMRTNDVEEEWEAVPRAHGVSREGIVRNRADALAAVLEASAIAAAQKMGVAAVAMDGLAVEFAPFLEARFAAHSRFGSDADGHGSVGPRP